MTIRAKFTVSSVTDHGGDGRTIKLHPQYDESIPEDQRFHQYTPTGSLEMYVTNPAVIAELTPGRVYYIDLVAAG
jgi:hypothetical protein